MGQELDGRLGGQRWWGRRGSLRTMVDPVIHLGRGSTGLYLVKVLGLVLNIVTISVEDIASACFVWRNLVDALVLLADVAGADVGGVVDPTAPSTETVVSVVIAVGLVGHLDDL